MPFTDQAGPQAGGHRHLFEMPDDVVYLNTSNMCPQLLAVRQAGEAALERRGTPWAVKSPDWFTDVETLRELFATLIGAEADGVALINATSYGLAIAAANIDTSPGDRVVMIAEDYPSTVYTWRTFAQRTGAEIVTVTRSANQSWTSAVLDALDARVRVVSVPNVRWTDGAEIDLVAVGSRAREIGAQLVVDVTQSLGVMPLDVALVQPDYVVCTGYKWLLGPFSIAYLYVAPQHRNGRPIEQNWILREGSDDFARLIDYRDTYAAGARRFDIGQRTNFTLTPMAIAALRQLHRWGVGQIASSLAQVTSVVEHRTRDLGLRPIPAAERGPHILGIELPASAPSGIAGRLADRKVFVSLRGSSIRVAPHLHTTTADIDRFIEALADELDP